MTLKKPIPNFPQLKIQRYIMKNSFSLRFIEMILEQEYCRTEKKSEGKISLKNILDILMSSIYIKF